MDMKIRSRTWKIEDVPVNTVREAVSEELDLSPELLDDQWMWREQERFVSREVTVSISEGAVTESVYGSNVLKAGFLLGLIFALYPLYFLLSLDQMFSTFVQSAVTAGDYGRVRWQVVLLLIGLGGCVLMGESANFSEFKVNLDSVGVIKQDSANPYVAFTLNYILAISSVGFASFLIGDQLMKISILAISAMIGGIYVSYRQRDLSWPVVALAIPLHGVLFLFIPLLAALLFSLVISQQEPLYHLLSVELLREIAVSGLVFFALVFLAVAVVSIALVLFSGSVIYDSVSNRELVLFECPTSKIQYLTKLAS
ncbi:hypothetical protein ABSL23_15435 [Halobacterium sp. NMX12-1]|uniref:Stage II sporulation protein M n=1 Tax=Halobacterium sp. NMX12-1 TaxID=3166650 RepID=A0AAU8CDE4_9EURY